MTDLHPYLLGSGPGVVHAIAHRGGDEQRENTLAAFAAAVAHGLQHLETDVHTTADGALVISHDATLARVAGDARPIATLTSAEVRGIRVAGSEPVPLLTELLAAFPTARVSIDLKDERAVGPMRDLLRSDRRLLERVCVGSFTSARVLPLRSEFGRDLCTTATPREVFAMLAAVRLRRRPPVIGGDLLAVPERYPAGRRGLRILDPGLLAAAAESGRPVHVWTVNDAERMRELVRLGAGGIVTDRPALLRDVLVELGAWG